MPLIPYHSRANSVYYGILFSHEGENTPRICPNVVGFWEHYAKRDNKDYDFLYVESLKKIKTTIKLIQRTGNWLMVTRGVRIKYVAGQKVQALVMEV